MTTDDDARARALEENRRRSKVMEQAQRHGPPAPREQENAPTTGPTRTPTPH